MDRTDTGFCPKCLQETLTIYFDEKTGLTDGVSCSFCHYRGLCVNGRLQALISA